MKKPGRERDGGQAVLSAALYVRHTKMGHSRVTSFLLPHCNSLPDVEATNQSEGQRKGQSGAGASVLLSFEAMWVAAGRNRPFFQGQWNNPKAETSWEEAQAQRPKYPKFKFQLFLCVMQDPEVFFSLSAQVLHPLSGENFCSSVLVCILYGEGRGSTELWSTTLSKSFLLPRACLLICKMR